MMQAQVAIGEVPNLRESGLIALHEPAQRVIFLRHRATHCRPMLVFSLRQYVAVVDRSTSRCWSTCILQNAVQATLRRVCSRQCVVRSHYLRRRLGWAYCAARCITKAAVQFTPLVKEAQEQARAHRKAQYLSAAKVGRWFRNNIKLQGSQRQ